MSSFPQDYLIVKPGVAQPLDLSMSDLIASLKKILPLSNTSPELFQEKIEKIEVALTTFMDYHIEIYKKAREQAREVRNYDYVEPVTFSQTLLMVDKNIYKTIEEKFKTQESKNDYLDELIQNEQKYIGILEKKLSNIENFSFYIEQESYSLYANKKLLKEINLALEENSELTALDKQKIKTTLTSRLEKDINGTNPAHLENTQILMAAQFAYQTEKLQLDSLTKQKQLLNSIMNYAQISSAVEDNSLPWTDINAPAPLQGKVWNFRDKFNVYGLDDNKNTPKL